MSHKKQVRVSQNESCPDGHLSVLWIFLLLDEHVEGDIYRFGVKDVEITEVAEKAEASIKTARHVM
jgi:hypothetical protein